MTRCKESLHEWRVLTPHSRLSHQRDSIEKICEILHETSMIVRRRYSSRILYSPHPLPPENILTKVALTSHIYRRWREYCDTESMILSSTKCCQKTVCFDAKNIKYNYSLPFYLRCVKEQYTRKISQIVDKGSLSRAGLEFYLYEEFYKGG